MKAYRSLNSTAELHRTFPDDFAAGGLFLERPQADVVVAIIEDYEVYSTRRFTRCELSPLRRLEEYSKPFGTVFKDRISGVVRLDWPL
jgi:hypothetical protein